MKYNCTYTGGGGTEHHDGEWEMKTTTKTTTLTKVKEFMTGVYAMHKVGEKIRIGKGTGNPSTYFGDGSFVVYFQQAGTPYYFEPIS